MNTVRNWIIVVILGLAVLVWFGSKTPLPNVQPATPKVYPTLQPNSGPDKLETSYMDGCTANGGNYSYCKCTYDYLINKYGVSNVIEMNNQVLDNKVPPELFEAVNSCNQNTKIYGD